MKTKAAIFHNLCVLYFLLEYLTAVGTVADTNPKTTKLQLITFNIIKMKSKKWQW